MSDLFLLPNPSQHLSTDDRLKVVIAVMSGRINVDSACRRYSITPEELERWQDMEFERCR